MMKPWLGLVAGAALGAFIACGGDEHHSLFTPKPECKGDPVAPYMGTYPQVISHLAIGSNGDGFDLDGNGSADNKLGGVAGLAQSAIDDSFKNYSILIPIEMFDMPAAAADTCVKFAVYLGTWGTDADGDGALAGMPGGDCNDHDPAIKPGVAEIADNNKDDNCDGRADETGSGSAGNSTDTVDHDGDGFSKAQGDCDDTNMAVHPGATELCSDGLDNDCDGEADRSHDANGNPTACTPYQPSADIEVDPRSLDASGAPQVAFTAGTIDKNMHLVSGPSIFSVKIPVGGIVTLDLQITGATIEADVQPDGSLKNARLGGVLDAKTLDTIRGLNVSQIMLTEKQSLLDATFANVLGDLLALPKTKNSGILKSYPNCKTPDIDVDGDGLEAFCETDPTRTNRVADVCIDGDGTTVMSTYDAEGNILDHCAQAVDKSGKPRFVDGVSVEINFETAPIHSVKPPG